MILDAASLYAFFVQDSERHWSVVGAVELALARGEPVFRDPEPVFEHVAQRLLHLRLGIERGVRHGRDAKAA